MTRNLPEFTGTYKAVVLGNIVEPSRKAKIPSLRIQVYLTEYYDVKEEEWIDVEAQNWIMTAFLCLYNSDKEKSLNHQQACKVFDWDGCGFDKLCSPDLEGMVIQVRIKESENEKFPVEITWIDVEDADPKGGFKRLSADEIKDLNSEFADFLDNKPTKAASSRKGKSAAASKTKAKAKAAAKAEEPETGDEEPAEEQTDGAEEEETTAPTPEEKKAALLKKSKRLRKQQEEARKKAAEAGPPKKAASKKKTKGRVIDAGEEMPDDFDKQDAWYTVTEFRDEACDDDMQTAEWEAAIEDIAPDGDEDQLDAEGWWKVKDRVLENIGKD